MRGLIFVLFVSLMLAFQSPLALAQQHLSTLTTVSLDDIPLQWRAQEGIAWDGAFFYTSRGTCVKAILRPLTIYKWDSEWNLIDSKPAANPLFDPCHIGDIGVGNGFVYAVLTNYYPLLNTQPDELFIIRYHADTLAHDISADASVIRDLYEFNDFGGITYHNGQLYIVTYQLDSQKTAQILIVNEDLTNFLGAYEITTSLANGIAIVGNIALINAGSSTTIGEIDAYDLSTLGPSTNIPVARYTYNISEGPIGIRHAQGLTLRGTELWVGLWSHAVRIETPPIIDGPPAIGYLTSSPGVVTPGTRITLTANNVVDPQGTANIGNVKFYRDVNGNCTLEVGVDDLLGTDYDDLGGWTWSPQVSETWGLGAVRFIARATDNDGHVSNVVCAAITVQPTTPSPDCSWAQGSNNAIPIPDNGSDATYFFPRPGLPAGWTISRVEYNIKITHARVSDLVVIISGEGASGILVWDHDGCATDCNDDDDSADDFDIELIWRVTNNWNGLSANAFWQISVFDTVANGLVGTLNWGHINVYYNAPGVPDLVVTSVWTVPSTPIVGQSCELFMTVKNQGSEPAFDLDIDYFIDGVDVQSDGHSELAPGFSRTEHDSYTFTEPGTFSYQACVVENGCISEIDFSNNCLSTNVTVEEPPNLIPTVISMTAQPNPVWGGENLTLTANGVVDQDGFVTLVEFYLDLNADCVADAGDRFLGNDGNGTDGWEIIIQANDLPEGALQLLAIAQDDNLEWSIPTCTDLQSILCTVNYPTSSDCNGNGIADACDIHFGFSEDLNVNGIPDSCDLISCPADSDLNGDVNVTDLLALLAAWGPNPGHVADINNDDNVNVTDLLALLAAWGPCPLNDNCATPDVITLGNTPFSTLVATFGGPPLPEACEEGFGLSFAPDLWFIFIPISSGTYYARTCNQADYDTRLAAYTGDCGSLSLIACNDDVLECTGFTSEMQFSALAGVPVRIRVGGYGVNQGTGTLTLSMVIAAHAIENGTRPKPNPLKQQNHGLKDYLKTRKR